MPVKLFSLFREKGMYLCMDINKFCFCFVVVLNRKVEGRYGEFFFLFTYKVNRTTK